MDSVLAQDHDDVEYIVVDPGSTDGSPPESFGAMETAVIRIFEPDAGPADGLNKGFALATGDVFGFVNSDDALLPGALACIAHAFASTPGIDVIAAAATSLMPTVAGRDAYSRLGSLLGCMSTKP